MDDLRRSSSCHNFSTARRRQELDTSPPTKGAPSTQHRKLKTSTTINLPVTFNYSGFTEHRLTNSERNETGVTINTAITQHVFSEGRKLKQTPSIVIQAPDNDHVQPQSKVGESSDEQSLGNGTKTYSHSARHFRGKSASFGHVRKSRNETYTRTSPDEGRENHDGGENEKSLLQKEKRNANGVGGQPQEVRIVAKSLSAPLSRVAKAIFSDRREDGRFPPIHHGEDEHARNLREFGSECQVQNPRINHRKMVTLNDPDNLIYRPGQTQGITASTLARNYLSSTSGKTIGKTFSDPTGSPNVSSRTKLDEQQRNLTSFSNGTQGLHHQQVLGRSFSDGATSADNQASEVEKGLPGTSSLQKTAVVEKKNGAMNEPRSSCVTAEAPRSGENFCGGLLGEAAANYSAEYYDKMISKINEQINLAVSRNKNPYAVYGLGSDDEDDWC